MLKAYTILFCSIFFFNGTIYAQKEQDKSSVFYQHLIQALSLYLTVDYNSAKIVSEKTEHSEQLFLETEKFKNKYRNAFTNLKNVLGAEQDIFRSTSDNLKFRLNEFYNKFPISSETAFSFTKKIKSYNEGINSEGAFRSLLIFQYLENPVEEFKDSFTNIFNTSGHIKAKNTKWTVRYPKSWKLEESDRPNTICALKSESDSLTSLTMVTLRVDEILDFSGEFGTLEFAKSICPKQANILNFTKLNIEGCPSGSVEYYMPINSSNPSFLKNLLFYFIYNNNIYSINCGCVTENQSDLQKLWMRNLPIFNQIINSVVLLDKFQYRN
jgi:hypothetical protein